MTWRFGVAAGILLFVACGDTFMAADDGGEDAESTSDRGGHGGDGGATGGAGGSTASVGTGGDGGAGGQGGQGGDRLCKTCAEAVGSNIAVTPFDVCEEERASYTDL